MKNIFDRLVYLWKQNLNEELTDTEKTELNQLLQNESYAKIFKDMEDPKYISERLKIQNSFDALKAYRNFSERTEYQKGLRAKKNRIRKLYIMTFSVAAVAVLFFTVTSLWRSQETYKTDGETIQSSTILARKTSAYIVLDNGERYDLKSEGRVSKDNSVVFVDKNTMPAMDDQDDTVKLEYNTIVVPRECEQHIVFSDGTQVWMNAESKLRYPTKFASNERQVFLEGEAYFTVKKSSAPFVVHTQKGNIKVLGTEFNIKAYSQKGTMETTLVNGSVMYSGIKELLLKPGEQCVVDVNGGVDKREVDVSFYTAWKDGVFMFKDARLEDIADDLSRWYGCDFIFETDKLKDIKFTANLEKYESINTLMELIKRTGIISYKIQDRTIIISE